MPKRSTHRWQFGLSSLLVVMVLAGLGARGVRWHLDGRREIEWQEYSAHRLSKYTTQGRVVLVVVRADWSTTVAVWERLVLDDPAVRREVHARRVVPLAFDVSEEPRHGIAADAAVLRNGSAGAPCAVVYCPSPGVLPIVLEGDFDAEQLVAAIEAAAR